MAYSTETGHAKNVANMGTLITNVSVLGDKYNPAKDSLKLAALNALWEKGKAVIGALNSAESVYKKACAERDIAFKPLSKLITRISNATKASGTSKQIDEMVKSLVRKLHGRRATPKMSEDEASVTEENGTAPVNYSSSQMSFDSRLDNLDKLIKLLASVPEYAPNEPDLQVSTLIAYQTELNAKNLAVTNAVAPLTVSRTERNDVIYTSTTGIVDISVDVKSYIKSVFGTTSPQYKAISRLKFTNYK